MNTILTVIYNRYKRSLFHKKKFLLLLFIPIIAAIIGVAANSINSTSLNIGLITDNSEYVSSINSIKNIHSEIVQDKNNLVTNIIMGKYDLVIDFSSKDISIQNVKSIKNIDTDKLINDVKLNQTDNKTIDDYETSNRLTPMNKTVAFLILMLFVTCTLNASLIIQDKKQGILDRIKVSSSKSIDYILGNVVYNLSLTFVQTLIALTLTKIFGMSANISYLQLLLVAILLSLVATTFGTLMGFLFDNDLYANLTASIVSLLLSLFGGTFIPFDNMPTGLQKIGAFSPTRWFVIMTSQSGLYIIQYIISALIFSMIFIILSIFVNLKKE